MQGTLWAGDQVAERWDGTAPVVLFPGDCREFLSTLPDGAARLIVTSPPYNLGKAYEQRRPLDASVSEPAAAIAACARVPAADGGLCWQVGPHAAGGQDCP